MKCETCGKPYKEQFIDGLNKGFFVPNCDCDTKRLQAEKETAIKQAKLRRVASLGLPPIYDNLWLKNLNCEYVFNAQIYVEGFNPKRSKGLFFTGSNGNGKSTLAAVICKELAWRGYKALFTTMSDILDKMEEGCGFNRAETQQKLLKSLKTYDFIVFDDYGRENYTPTRTQNAFRIIDTLYINNIAFCLTCNPECIKRIADIPEMAAIKDRIGQVLTPYVFRADSFRKGGTK